MNTLSFLRYMWRVLRCRHDWQFQEEVTDHGREMIRRCPKCREAEFCGRRSRFWMSLWENGRWPE